MSHSFRFKTSDKPSVIILAGRQKPVRELYSRISDIIKEFTEFPCSEFVPRVSEEVVRIISFPF